MVEGNKAERGNREERRNRGGRKGGKPNITKRVLLNCYCRATQKVKKLRERRERAAAAARNGDQTELGDTAAGEENDATGPSLWS